MSPDDPQRGGFVLRSELALIFAASQLLVQLLPVLHLPRHQHAVCLDYLRIDISTNAAPWKH
jgi:hypothetical protein